MIRILFGVHPGWGVFDLRREVFGMNLRVFGLGWRVWALWCFWVGLRLWYRGIPRGSSDYSWDDLVDCLVGCSIMAEGYLNSCVEAPICTHAPHASSPKGTRRVFNELFWFWILNFEFCKSNCYCHCLIFSHYGVLS